jgi:acyl-CoA thioesterase
MSKIFLKKAEDIFYNIPFVQTIGIKLIEVNAVSASAEFTVRNHLSNYIGGLHGGAIAGVIDTLVFFPGKLLPSGLKLTTSGFDIKFFRPASVNDVIEVYAEITHFGKRRINVDAEAFLKKEKKLIAKANADLMVI